jgi:hypothetical protein
MARSGTTRVVSEGTPEQVARLHRLGRELRLTDQILTFDLDRTAVVATGPAPAWTSLDGDEVTFCTAFMPEPVTPYDIAIWLGTNAHEVGHVLFSPRGDSTLMKRVISASQTTRPSMARTHNIIEDQRQERLLLGRFSAWRGYLLAALAHHIDPLGLDSWVLLAGRTWLPAEVRALSRANFVVSHDEDTAAAVERIVGSYQRLSDPGEADWVEAWALIEELDRLVRVEHVTIPPRSCTVIQGGEPDTDEAEGEWLPAAADDPEPENEAPGSPESDEDDPSGMGTAEVDQGKRSESQPSTPEPEAPKASPSPDSGRRPKAPSKAQEAVAKAAAKALAEEAGDDLERVVDAINSPSEAGDATADHSEGTWLPTTDRAMQLEREVSDALLDLRDNVEPGWDKRTDSGRLNVRRLLTSYADADELFDRFNPGALEAVDFEVVLLLDVSGSMGGSVLPLSEALWAIRHAVDKLEGRLTAYTFDTRHMVLCEPGERPDDRLYLLDAMGGTDPTEAWYEAHRIVEGSSATQKLVIALTDGGWFSDRATDAVKACNEAGAVTALAVLGSYRSWDRMDFGQQITRRIEAPGALALLFRSIAEALIKEKS